MSDIQRFNGKIIKRYLSQRVTGYTQDFKHLHLLCEILYTDGTTATVTEVRRNIQLDDRLFDFPAKETTPVRRQPLMPTYNIDFQPVTTPPAKEGEYLAQVLAGDGVDFSTVIAVQYRQGKWWCPTVLVEQPAGGWVFRAYDISDLVEGWAEFPFGLTPLANLSDVGYGSGMTEMQTKQEMTA